jgi:protease-4
MTRRLVFSVGIVALVAILGQQAVRGAPLREDKKSDSAKAMIAVFRLHGEISESPSDDGFPFSMEGKISFKDLVTRMKKTATDPSVKAVVMYDEGGTLGAGQKEELREVMGQIRKAGKDIYVHADSLSMGDYVLLSGASRLSVVPTGDLWITGLHGEAPYVRGLLDLLGVKPDYLTCGEYKSAAEIFMRHGPSPEAERMQNWLLDSLYDTYVKLIAKGRGVDVAKVRAWIDAGPYTAEKAKEAGLIDAVEHRQQFVAQLKSKFGQDVVFNRKYGAKKTPKLNFSNPLAMFNILGDMLGESVKEKSSKSAIAIVYVDGAISLGASQPSPFGMEGAMSSDIRKALDDAAKDESIKAVVLRVDSPGGSAVASEIILDATQRVKARKPFVVSMGNVAGSGGYYVACGSDVIFADEATITGSIGVVGGKFVTTGMWNKIGVTFKEYKRGENAALLSSSEAFTKPERERMQAWMDSIYNVFKGHVTAIRGSRLKKPLDEIAGGRVYTGRQALELGLVDKIGGLQDAIKHVASQAKVSDYEVRVVPEPKNFIERLLEELSGGKDDAKELDTKVRLRLTSRQASLVDLAAPYLQQLDPQRVAAIKTALGRMQLLQAEGAVLMMPEMIFSR